MKSLFCKRVRICFFGCFLLFAFIGSAFAGNSYRSSNSYGDKTMVVFGGWDVYSGNRDVMDVVQHKDKLDERKAILSDFETYMKTAGSTKRTGELASRVFSVVKNYIKSPSDGFEKEIELVSKLLDKPWDYHDDEHWVDDLAKNMGIPLVADYSTPMGFISTLGQRKKLMDTEVNEAEDSLFCPSLTAQVFKAARSDVKNVRAIVLSAGLEDILNWCANQTNRKGGFRDWEYTSYVKSLVNELVSSIGNFLKEKHSGGPAVLVFVKQEVKRFESVWPDLSVVDDLEGKLKRFNDEVLDGLKKMLGDDFKEVSLLSISPDDVSSNLLDDLDYSYSGDTEYQESYQDEIEEKIKTDKANGWGEKGGGLEYVRKNYFDFLAIAEGNLIRGLIRERLKAAYYRHEIIPGGALREHYGSRLFYCGCTDSIDFGDKVLEELCLRLKNDGGRTQCIAEDSAGKIKVSRISPEYKSEQGLAESLIFPWINGYVDKAGDAIGGVAEKALTRLLDQRLGLRGR